MEVVRSRVPTLIRLLSLIRECEQAPRWKPPAKTLPKHSPPPLGTKAPGGLELPQRRDKAEGMGSTWAWTLLEENAETPKSVQQPG
ncbi:hypothetical protein NDU88_000120 [Pleurodeles waltl]|uniref:Uncharacterized protein n=1 Tax=Pleurodeles waltl TaxID=8319 RepID=A0AAV7S8Q8_PLEWA|nr:hypothetical protein NDU88_000120 [Pleurodeles waltl]